VDAIDRAILNLEDWINGRHVDLGRARAALNELTAFVRISSQRGWHKEAQETLAVNMQQGREIDQLRAFLAAATQRAEAAEAALAAVPDYVTYYACAWEGWEEGTPAPLDFAEWLAAGKPEVQP